MLFSTAGHTPDLYQMLTPDSQADKPRSLATALDRLRSSAERLLAIANRETALADFLGNSEPEATVAAPSACPRDAAGAVPAAHLIADDFEELLDRMERHQGRVERALAG